MKLLRVEHPLKPLPKEVADLLHQEGGRAPYRHGQRLVLVVGMHGELRSGHGACLTDAQERWYGKLS